jgi:predicted Rossmann fold nucleotide-binding protein DprA/Smf involved in DNA uptake
LESTLTSDTQAVLLLCGDLGQRGNNGPKPLGLRLYNTLATWLRAEGLRPGDLLASETRKRLDGLQTSEVNFDRIAPLLERGAALALSVEKWERSGLWVISRSDACYPDRLKRYLGQSAPPLLYGVGSKDLLNRGGLAVVGSRDHSEEDGEFACRVGEYCAKEGIAVISGAAKGIDREAMSGALEGGGWALGVLAEGLAKTATSGQYRSGLVSDHLSLVSPYDPDSRWFAYAAMDRNKILYGLSDAALVVASSADSGGTWAGATEALQQSRVKVFVKSTGTLAPGNSKLLRMGGVPFPTEPWENLPALFTAPQEKNRRLFSEEAKDSTAATTRPEGILNSTDLAETKMAEQEPLRPGVAGAFDCSVEPAPVRTTDEAYSLVVETIVNFLDQPQSEKWLAAKVNVPTSQMKDWLGRAIREGRVTKIKKKPVLYLATSRTLFRR